MYSQLNFLLEFPPSKVPILEMDIWRMHSYFLIIFAPCDYPCLIVTKSQNYFLYCENISWLQTNFRKISYPCMVL